MLSQHLDYNVRHRRGYIGHEPDNGDPFELIDVRDPLGESKERIKRELDAIERSFMKLRGLLSEMADNGVSVTLDLERRSSVQGGLMDASCTTALLVASTFRDEGVKVSFRTGYEQAQCVFYLISEVMNSMKDAPEWWTNLEKELYGPHGRPYWANENNEALHIIATAMASLKGMDYADVGGVHYRKGDPPTPTTTNEAAMGEVPDVEP